VCGTPTLQRPRSQVFSLTPIFGSTPTENTLLHAAGRRYFIVFAFATPKNGKSNEFNLTAKDKKNWVLLDSKIVLPGKVAYVVL